MEYQGAVTVSKIEQISYAILEDYRAGRLSRAETAKKLGVSERTVTRKAKKIRIRGIAGIKHGNMGRRPWNKIKDEVVEQYVELYKRKYAKFNFTHALEMMRMHDDLAELSYTRFHKACRKQGLGKVKKRRTSRARMARERFAEEGFMWQMDGSPDKWNGRTDWSLLALIDDATSKVPNAKFENSETTWGCMNLVKEAILKHGIPEFILTDNAGWSSSSIKRRQFSQFERACRELGITVITTSTPESKGRIERLNRTFQDRLIPELDLYGIVAQKDANRYLEQCFLPEWDKRYTVEPKAASTRYRPIPIDKDLNDVFCIKDVRIVNRNHTVTYGGQTYLLQPLSGSLWRKEIIIHEYEDGSVTAFYGSQRLVTIAKRASKYTARLQKTG